MYCYMKKSKLYIVCTVWPYFCENKYMHICTLKKEYIQNYIKLETNSILSESYTTKTKFKNLLPTLQNPEQRLLNKMDDHCVSLGPLKETNSLKGKWSEVKSLSRVRLFMTPWTVAYQASQTMGFSRQEYWSGLPFPSPGDLPDPGIEPGSPAFWQTLYPLSHQGSHVYICFPENCFPIFGFSLPCEYHARLH